MSLLEILLATLILCLGLLGFARVEVLALQNNEIAYFQSIATLQLNAMSEHIRACQTTDNPATCVTNATPSWKADNKALLPQVKSSVRHTKNNYSLSIQWQSPVAHGTATTKL